MNLMITASLLVIATAAVIAGIAVVLRNYYLFRATRLIVCPETREPAAVKLNAGHATETSIYDHKPELRLSACSRWPEREDCDQACVRQIEADPQGTLVRRIVARWYEGANCVLCAQPIRQIGPTFHTAAVIKPGFETTAWAEVLPENLPAVLETAQPVCWSCHITETFRREHPELIIERPPHRSTYH